MRKRVLSMLMAVVLLVACLPATVFATADETKALADAIASRYANEGVANDQNAPWFAADMAAYLKTYPQTENKLTEEQKQDMADVAIYELKNSEYAKVSAKYIIALAAMGYDPTRIKTSDGNSFDAVTEKLIPQSFSDGEVMADAKSEYTLPYVLIALQQFGDTYNTEIEKLINAAIETEETWNKIAYWYDGDPGSVDAITFMMLALAPYYENVEVEAVLDDSVAIVKGFQSANGSLGENAASTGIGAVAFAALGTEPDSIVQTDSENSLVDYLLTQINTENNGFTEPSYGGSFNTEQGFRGLLAALNAENEVPYYLYDFSGQSLSEVTERAGVTFDIIPQNAIVTLKNSEDVIQTEVSPHCYDLASGEYTYTVSCDGYVTKSGSLTVEDVKQKQKISISLISAANNDNSDITVRVKVITHDKTACNGQYTYKNNADKYTEVLANERVTLESGQSVFDALIAALDRNNIDYDETSPGYIGKIGDDEEFGHGSTKSGWKYIVDGISAKVGCRSYKLNYDASVVWFYTDDYTDEYGSEIFNTSSNRNDKAAGGNQTENKKDVLTIENAELNEIINDTVNYLYKAVPEPTSNAVGGEWTIIGMSRGNADIPQEYYEKYYENIKEKLIENSGVLHNTKYTEYSRAVIALTAIGKNPKTVAGYDVLTPVMKYDNVIKQGINGPIWALIALDSGNYGDSHIREKYISFILDRELDGGGFALTADDSEVNADITAMALVALSEYTDDVSVKNCVDRAVKVLFDMQNENGGFSLYGDENPESAAQVLIAISTLGIDCNDSRFVKNGKTIIDNILQYRVKSGGFSHIKNSEADIMTSEQVLYALVSAQRLQNKENALFDIGKDMERNRKRLLENIKKQGLLGRMYQNYFVYR